jgi:transcriptional regulatory protein RtcR
VLCDWAEAYPFDLESCDYLVHITTGTHVMQICWFMLVETRRVPARLLQTVPSRSQRKDSKGSYKIIDLDLSRYDALASRFEAERQDSVSFLKAGIETRNAGFNRLMDRVEEVASASDAPILLTGPTGVGKTKLAGRIFELKQRQHRVGGGFVQVNCATLRGDGAMSTLFGHEKGAFTGAEVKREGLLRAADGGLLFLDEIGDLGLDEQAMLLRAIEEGVFLPLGADAPVSSSFQLIAGTNRDLRLDVESGAFRGDLLARIDLWTFEMPALAQRLEDLEPNLDYELVRFESTNSRRVTFNQEARSRYLEFATGPEGRWLGNSRDLAGSVTRLATLARGGRISVELVDEELGRLRRAWRGSGVARQDLAEAVLGEQGAAELDRFDRIQLSDVVAVCSQATGLSMAGRQLFAVSRTKKASRNDVARLSKYLARFGLTFEDVQGPCS